MEDRLVPALTLASLYAGAVAILYLLGFWSVFDLNILEYVGITDVISVAVYPLAGLLISPVLGAVLGSAFTHLVFGEAQPDLPLSPRKIAATFLLSMLVVLLLVIALIARSQEPARWLTLILAAFPLGFVLQQSDLAAKLVPDAEIRRWLIFVGVLMPFLAFALGRFRGELVLTHPEVVRRVAREVLPDSLLVTASDPLYLGKAGNHVIMLSPEQGSLIVLNYEHVPGIILRSPVK